MKEDGSKWKERRAAAGTEAVREQIRKLAVGGPPGKGDTAVYQVSDSEDEDLEDSEDIRHPSIGNWQKPQYVTDDICHALQKNFIFKGISQDLLLEVVGRMYGVCFPAGATVLQQGALPKPDDCMYFLEQGEAEVVISGAIDQQSKGQVGEERQVQGNTVHILERPGWVFGDLALLFHLARTASIVAKTNITVWALNRKTFLKFVMKHAQGARALRFLRKLPLLKGLGDQDLIHAASRMPQRVYEDGQALISYGERGDELFLIRYGKVRVLRPDGKGGRIEVVQLGRGQFVGERAVINDRLRSADCVAQGTVQVVVMRKRDFMDLDNPLLAWMLDYDAVSACLRTLSILKGVKQEQMEQILDRFDAREELWKGHTIVKQGQLMEKLCVIKFGEVQLYQDGRLLEGGDPSFVQEAGGFTFFGAEALQSPVKSKYTVKVASEMLHLLCLPKSQLDSLMGWDMSLKTTDQVVAALKKSRYLSNLSEVQIKTMLQASVEVKYSPGDVIAVANGHPNHRVFMVKSGEVTLVSPDVHIPGPGQIEVKQGMERGRLMPGNIFNDEAVLHGSGNGQGLKASLVASAPNTVIVAFTAADVERIAGSQLAEKPKPLSGFKSIDFGHLEYHRIVGTGQFGLVRVVRNTRTNEVYALKVMHKAPIVESKQIEHVLNERRILQEASSHQFCVKLCGAYQDRNSLYLLQEWVPGGELFHHLDLEGAFDEPTAMFFAASVLLSLEFLHNKGIVYRDLKPENLLLDAHGYIKLADFGFAKQIGSEKTYTICGTPDYQSPEVIMRRGTTRAADYWALGVLIFEMLVGDPPFKSLTGDPWDTFRRTLSGRFYVPNFVSDTAADLIFKLLQVNPDKRLGTGPQGAMAIKKHRWFARLDWNALEQRKLIAPIRPRVRNPLDTSNFDNFDNCDVEAPPVPANRMEKHLQLWDMWEWIEKPPTV